MNGREERKAELLDRALQRMLEGKAPFEDSVQAEAGGSAGLLPLLATASRVRILIRARAPLPDFVASLESRLLKQNPLRPPMPAPRAAPVPAGARWGRLRTAALIAVFTVLIMIGSGWGAASVSAQALPGDALYPIKRGFEEAALTFTFSPAGDVEMLAEFTDRRLAEVEQLADLGRESDLLLGLAYYEQTLSRLDAAIRALPLDAGSAQWDSLQARLARHTDVLSALRDRLPEQAQPALDLAVEHSQETNDTVEELRNNLGPEFVTPAVAGSPTGEPASDSDGSSPTTPPATATPTPEPSRTAEPSATPESTTTPTPSETGEPTGTPKPSRTPKPTDTPKPSKTPKPTDEPKPTDTPKPAEPTKPPQKPSETPKATDTLPPYKTAPVKTAIPTNTPNPSSNTGASKIA